MPGDGYKYKFLNKEYEDSFALNVTETDFRHYDSALGRFNVLDPMAELAPDFTPYRYGFNNPVFWQDASGLFETYQLAAGHLKEMGLIGKIEYNQILKGYTITIIGGEFDGTMFYDFGELLPEVLVGRDGSGSAGGSESSSSKKSEAGLGGSKQLSNEIKNSTNTAVEKAAETGVKAPVDNIKTKTDG